MTTGYSLDSLLERIREQTRPKTEEEKRAARAVELEDAVTIAAAFDGEAGQRALAVLWRKFGSPIQFDANLGFFEGAAMGFQRTGMTMVLNYIGQKISEARRGAKSSKKGSRR